ncbi:hypothetical protein ABZV91_22970 [Nocardia sp. NPDC004568]|uniref:hypothetical protein n=1 Tax=Nocardia sp. NPDC004568 TaxID=3154551 RepID=UPI0033BC118A
MQAQLATDRGLAQSPLQQLVNRGMLMPESFDHLQFTMVEGRRRPTGGLGGSCRWQGLSKGSADR